MALTNVIVLPDEIDVVKSVFDEIVVEPWFDNTVDSRCRFAAFVLRVYHEGVCDRKPLLTICRVVAKKGFSV